MTLRRCRLRPLHCAVLGAVLGANAALIGCRDATTTPASDAALAGDAASADVVGADAGTSATWPAGDLALVQALVAMRAASAQAAAKPWPTAALWPAFALHAAPTCLAIRNGKGDFVRAYLIGAAAAPPGAAAMPTTTGATPVYRYDAATAQLWVGFEASSDMTIAGVSTLVVAAGLGDAESAEWRRRVVAGYMMRLREVETPWQVVQACGQSHYPRVEAAIALLFLECAVLKEALGASDDAVRTQRLREWAAVRSAAIDASNLIGQRYRHYDNTFASEAFVGARLEPLLSGGSAATTQQLHLDALALPFAASPSAFDDLMFENGSVGAAAIEVAARLGIDVEPAYRDADTVHKVVLGKLGPVAATLVDDAKKRHDFGAFVARGAQIGALPGATPGFDP